MEAPTFAELIDTLEQLRRLAADSQWMGRDDKETYWTACKELIAVIKTKIATV